MQCMVDPRITKVCRRDQEYQETAGFRVNHCHVLTDEYLILSIWPLSIHCRLAEIGWGEEIGKFSAEDRRAFESLNAFQRPERLSTSGNVVNSTIPLRCSPCLTSNIRVAFYFQRSHFFFGTSEGQTSPEGTDILHQVQNQVALRLYSPPTWRFALHRMAATRSDPCGYRYVSWIPGDLRASKRGRSHRGYLPARH